MVRICRKCGKEKDIKKFYLDKTCKFGHGHICKICHVKGKKERGVITPEKQREQYLKNSYGFGTEEYNRLFQLQDGKCLICSRHQSELKERLHVDHCHNTGHIRGLLCKRCNVKLEWYLEYSDSIIAYIGDRND